MIDTLTVARAHIVPDFLDAIPPCNPRQRLRRIIFIPPVRSEKVNDFFLFPSPVQLGVHSTAELPPMSEAVFHACNRSQLRVSSHVLAEDIVGRPVRIPVRCDGGIPVHMSVSRSV